MVLKLQTPFPAAVAEGAVVPLRAARARMLRVVWMCCVVLVFLLSSGCADRHSEEPAVQPGAAAERSLIVVPAGSSDSRTRLVAVDPATGERFDVPGVRGDVSWCRPLQDGGFVWLSTDEDAATGEVRERYAFWDGSGQSREITAAAWSAPWVLDAGQAQMPGGRHLYLWSLDPDRYPAGDVRVRQLDVVTGDAQDIRLASRARPFFIAMVASPDGRRAFVWNEADEDSPTNRYPSDLRVVDLPGAGQVLQLSDEQPEDVSWSHDGKLAVYRTGSACHVLRLDGGRPEPAGSLEASLVAGGVGWDRSRRCWFIADYSRRLVSIDAAGEELRWGPEIALPTEAGRVVVSPGDPVRFAVLGTDGSLWVVGLDSAARRLGSGFYASGSPPDALAWGVAGGAR